METRMSVLFYGKKTGMKGGKMLPVYMRVTINGKRFEVSSNRSIEPSKWSVAAGRVKGNSEEARTFNHHLDFMKQKVYEHQALMLREGVPFTLTNLKDRWHGSKKKEQPHTLLSVFKSHNDQMKALIGHDCSKATHTKYNTTYDHTAEFIKYKFQKIDLDITSISYHFITDFEFWLKTEKKCCHNTAIKYISNLRKIINLCLKNGWLVKDPFVGFKMTKKEVVRDYLTESELQVLMTKEITNIRIKQVRDIFLFSCFTGLAYIDAKRLKRSQVVPGIDGERWIFTSRKKTDTPTRLPLLPVVQEILEAYKDHPVCVATDSLLPVPSNCKLNAYLKEIADICGINKHLTFHIARHTFATTVTLSNGVPIETVSKMLGHKSIKITQVYAKIVDRKISEDMSSLKSKYSLGRSIEIKAAQ